MRAMARPRHIHGCARSCWRVSRMRSLCKLGGLTEAASYVERIPMNAWIATISANLILAAAAAAQNPAPAQAAGPDPDSIRTLVARLDLEAYKSTVKGLTHCGERRQGTLRNRAAIDGLGAQVTSRGGAALGGREYAYD